MHATVNIRPTAVERERSTTQRNQDSSQQATVPPQKQEQQQHEMANHILGKTPARRQPRIKFKVGVDGAVGRQQVDRRGRK